MDIRYGFDITVDFAQPTTFLTMMDVHSDFRNGVVEETALNLQPIVPAERFIDDCGNVVRRLSAPAGTTSLRLQGVYRTDGCADEVDTAAEAALVSDLPPEALPFLRPSRYCETEALMAEDPPVTRPSHNGIWRCGVACADQPQSWPANEIEERSRSFGVSSTER